MLFGAILKQEQGKTNKNQKQKQTAKLSHAKNNKKSKPPKFRKLEKQKLQDEVETNEYELGKL